MKTYLYKVFYLLILLAGLGSCSLLYANLLTKNTLLQDAKNFLMNEIKTLPQEKLHVAIKEIDPRLKIKDCESNIIFFIPQGLESPEKTNRLGVQCLDNKGWKFYLTVELQIFAPVTVAKSPILKGTPLSKNLLQQVMRDRLHLPRGYFNDFSALQGYVAKHFINTHSLITRHDIEKPVIVFLRKPVKIIAKSAVLQVSSKGLALMNGREGDWIPVKNLSSHKTLYAKVIGPGTVSVSFS